MKQFTFLTLTLFLSNLVLAQDVLYPMTPGSSCSSFPVLDRKQHDPKLCMDMNGTFKMTERVSSEHGSNAPKPTLVFETKFNTHPGWPHYREYFWNDPMWRDNLPESWYVRATDDGWTYHYYDSNNPKRRRASLVCTKNLIDAYYYNFGEHGSAVGYAYRIRISATSDPKRFTFKNCGFYTPTSTGTLVRQ